jgi:hypothetical protein
MCGICAVFWLGFPAPVSCAEQPAVIQPPEIVSVAPVGLERASNGKIELRGKHLDGVYAVWFDTRGVEARIESIQKDDEVFPVPKGRKEKKDDKSPRQIVLAQASVNGDVALGKHSVRLIGPGGISNEACFLVQSERAHAEINSDHSSPEKAQPVSVPLLLQGKLAQTGEVDYYSFDAAAGEQLVFHGLSNTPSSQGGFDALQFTLYATGGSWFDPNRAAQIAFSDVPLLRYRFTKAGRYLLGVSAFMGIGGPDFAYQISIDKNRELHTQKLQASVTDLVDQTFARDLEPNRMEQLWARTVFPQLPQQPEQLLARASAASVSASGQPPHSAVNESVVQQDTALVQCTSYQEREPNDSPGEAQEFALPAMVEGTIGHPGDVDDFKFKAKAGQRIAVELETPSASLPEFNPRIALLDSSGQEILNNIWRRVGGDNNEWMKTLQPKTIFTVDRDGEYTLQVRDLVSYLYGDQSFRYRIVIRPQVPHVGKIEMKQDRVNLVSGQAEKLNLKADQEEGYTGDIAVTVENLPPGVQVLPAAEVAPEAGPKLDEGPKERYIPKEQNLAILLVASADAPPTKLPYLAHVVARPVVSKQVGPSLPVRDIPVMVIRPALAPPGNDAQQGTTDRSDQ